LLEFVYEQISVDGSEKKRKHKIE
jgi:hypothetical protein